MPGPLDRDSVLAALASGGGRSWATRRLLTRLGARPGEGRRLRRILRELESEGRVECFDGHVRLRREDGLVEGEFQPQRGERNGGSVFDESGRILRVARSEGAREGDRVLVWPTPGRRRGEAGERGEIVRILSAPSERVVGRIEYTDRGASLEPYGRSEIRSYRVARADLGGALDGEVVEAVAHRRGSSREPWARVVERLGRPGEPDVDFAAVVWRRRLPVEFPREAVAEAETAAVRGETPGRRRDLRAAAFVTIDPATARDHDDAVYVEAGGGDALRLWVAIADVSHFVAEGGALEREALRRGNSVYFPDRAIPMLPERLSSDLCSLVPDADRLALVAELLVDGHGAVQQERFHRAWIRSRARLSYAQAAAVMEGSAGREVAADLHGPLLLLGRVADRLRARRLSEGALDLELPEAQIELDSAGRPVATKRAPRTVAHRAIEDAMLAANRAVARFLAGRRRACVHRVHEPPSEEALAGLAEKLARFGLLDDDGAPLDTHRIAAALARAAGTPHERIASWMTLRAMKQAHYEPESRGHFALGFEHYLHFTSPIRRCADLAVHRALKAELDGEPASEHADETAARIAARASVCERVAVDAEREMIAIKQAAVMQERLGEHFEARVSSVTDFGLFASVDDPFVDGLVELESLGAGYQLDRDGQRLVASRSGRSYGLGDSIRVRVEAVDVFRGWIRFGLASRPA